MIPRLASPSVCVIDDEPPDYQPILDALLKLGIASVHVRGDSASPLPPQPFKGLRIVFTDLHLANSSGKNVAAHTANVFKAVVSADTAPVLVVIWSKHKDDPAGDDSLPPADQPTLADEFRRELLEAEPRFNGRLIFTIMPKPTRGVDRPDDASWVTTLQADIESKLQEFPACDLLWSWESLVREAGIAISESLTTLALHPIAPATAATASTQLLDEKLKLVFRHLAKEQGGPDCSPSSASRHLTAVLAQSLADELEHSEGLDVLSHHGTWLSGSRGLADAVPFASQLNGLLLTAAPTTGGRSFVPGMVYKITQPEMFKNAFDEQPKELLRACYAKRDDGGIWPRDEWEQKIVPVLVEISPVCDFHQGTRRQALLVAGVLGPAIGRVHGRESESCKLLPPFFLRWSLDGFAPQDVFLLFCSRYKLTLPPRLEPEGLKPWFRLKELPTASLRNWHASHAARVGYVSLP